MNIKLWTKLSGFTLSALNIFYYGSENFTKHKKERDTQIDFNQRFFKLKNNRKSNFVVFFNVGRPNTDTGPVLIFRYNCLNF